MSEIKYRICNLEDLNRLYDFYNLIIDNQKHDKYTPMWTKDVYPTKQDLLNHIKNNKFYIYEIDNKIIASLAFQIGEEEMYEDMGWSITKDVSVIHLLAVNPKHRNKGYAKSLLLKVINENKNKIKAVHLDVMLTNLSASKLYESVGFKYIGQKEVYYEDTGKIVANLYEYII